jgi:uncharacterized RDD family membrane protein YckC
MARRLATLAPSAVVTPDTEASANGGAVDVPVDEGVLGAEQAGLGLRLMAYALDSVFLFAFTMLFATASFLNIFLRSDSGRETASDGTIWLSVYMLLLTVPAWLLFNLALTSRRGHTVGQYVMGLRLASADELPLRPKRLVAYWLALHPLLYHPILAGFWLLFAWVAISISERNVLFILGLALGFLCILAPFAGLAFALFDRRRRAIHDRLAGVRVCRLD